MYARTTYILREALLFFKCGDMCQNDFSWKKLLAQLLNKISYWVKEKPVFYCRKSYLICIFFTCKETSITWRWVFLIEKKRIGTKSHSFTHLCGGRALYLDLKYTRVLHNAAALNIADIRYSADDQKILNVLAQCWTLD